MSLNEIKTKKSPCTKIKRRHSKVEPPTVDKSKTKCENRNRKVEKLISEKRLLQYFALLEIGQTRVTKTN